MKNILIITLLVSSIGIIGFSQDSKSLGNNSFATLLIVILIIIFPLYQAYKYYNYKTSIYSIIDLNLSKLTRQIKENEKDIEVLREKIVDMKQRLQSVRQINLEVKSTIEENVTIWENQIDIYKKIIKICEKRKNALTQNKDEIDLLNHMRKQIEKEPNSIDKIKRLEKLIIEIDNKVNAKITGEIESLINSIKSDFGNSRIIEFNSRIKHLEKNVS